MRYTKYILIISFLAISTNQHAKQLFEIKKFNHTFDANLSNFIVIIATECDCGKIKYILDKAEKGENLSYDYVLSDGKTVLETICCCDSIDALKFVFNHARKKSGNECDMYVKSWLYALYYDAKGVIKMLNEPKLVNYLWSSCSERVVGIISDTIAFKQNFVVNHDFSKIKKKNFRNCLFSVLVSDNYAAFDKIYYLCQKSTKGQKILRQPVMQYLAVSTLDTTIITKMLPHCKGKSEYRKLTITGNAIQTLLLTTSFEGYKKELPDLPHGKAKMILTFLNNQKINTDYWGEDGGNLVGLIIESPSILRAILDGNLNINSLIDGKNTFLELILKYIKAHRTIHLNNYLLFEEDITSEFRYKFEILDMFLFYGLINEESLESIYFGLMKYAILENDNTLAIEILNQRKERLQLTTNKAFLITLAAKYNNTELISILGKD